MHSLDRDECVEEQREIKLLLCCCVNSGVCFFVNVEFLEGLIVMTMQV